MVFILLLLCGAGSVHAQLQDLWISKAGSIKLYYTFNAVSNPNFTYEPNQRAPFKTFGFEADIYDFRAGKGRWNFACKYLDDILWVAFHQTTEKGRERHEGQDYYSFTGLFWNRYAWNLFDGKRFCLAAGISGGDYYVEIPNILPIGSYSGQPSIMEPSGWYLAAGPAIMADLFIIDGLSLHLQSNYDFSFLTIGEGAGTKQIIDGYKTPNFWRNSLTLIHNWGPFLQFDYGIMFDRGEHEQSITRTEFHIGYSFLIGANK